MQDELIKIALEMGCLIGAGAIISAVFHFGGLRGAALGFASWLILVTLRNFF